MPIQYSEDHTWLQIEGDGDTAVMGITLHAQDTLGDIVFVDLPAIGKTFAAKEVAGVVESVKAAADVYMPVDGEITEVNEELRADPWQKRGWCQRRGRVVALIGQGTRACPWRVPGRCCGQ